MIIFLKKSHYSKQNVLYLVHNKAINKIIRIRKILDIKQLGTLPWPTKLDSNVTSLAIITKY